MIRSRPDSGSGRRPTSPSSAFRPRCYGRVRGSMGSLLSRMLTQDGAVVRTPPFLLHHGGGGNFRPHPRLALIARLRSAVAEIRLYPTNGEIIPGLAAAVKKNGDECADMVRTRPHPRGDKFMSSNTVRERDVGAPTEGRAVPSGGVPFVPNGPSTESKDSVRRPTSTS
jgi:hypothetical protein